MTLVLFSILIAVVGSSALAPAQDSVSLAVMDEVVVEGYVRSTAKFEISKETGRAWVEADVENGSIGDDYQSYTFRAEVPNLSYDTQTQEIVYSHEGFRVICAKVTQSRFLFTRQTKIRGTGNCRLLARFERKRDDSGFEYQTNKHLIVELKITR